MPISSNQANQPARLWYKYLLPVLFVKKFLFKGIVHSLKPLFRPHRAQVMWRVSWHLLNHSIPVAEPEGYLIKQRGPFCLKGYFFARVLPRCLALAELAKDLDPFTKRFDSEGLIETLVQNVARMHSSGVSHGDLKWSNILVHEDKNELWFVDIDITHSGFDSVISPSLSHESVYFHPVFSTAEIMRPVKIPDNISEVFFLITRHELANGIGHSIVVIRTCYSRSN